MRRLAPFFLLLIFFGMSSPLIGQDKLPEERLQQMRQYLEDLATTNPGLNERVDFSVSGASIQEFLRGLAEANNLNIAVDPSLDFRVYNNFTNERVLNILLFLAREYNLEIRFIGSIMSFHPYKAPPSPKVETPTKEISVKYNAYSDQLTLDLQNDTLEKVVKKITQESKKNVIISSGLGNRLVSVYIQDAPFDHALEKMAFANNLKLAKTADNFYILKAPGEGEELLTFDESKPKSNYNNPFPKIERKTGAAPPAGNQQQGSLFVDVKADSLGQALISVEALNVPISETIKSVAEAVGISYFLFSDIKGNATTRVLNVLFDDFLKRLLQGTDYTYKLNNGLYLIGERKLEGLRANKVIQLQYRSAKDVMEVIPAELRRNVELKEFIELNSLLLTGSQPQIEEIEAFIRHIDRVVPMVLIEVIIVDIRKGRTVSTGLSAGVSDTVSSGGTLFPNLNFKFSSRSINDFLARVGLNNIINLGQVSPNFYIQLRALEDNNNVEVRSTPKLSTLNGHKATLSIGSTRYYVNETQNVLGSLNPQTVITRQFHQVEANLNINILPIVSGDDQVTLEIEVSNSDFLEPTTNAPPPSAKSEFNSLVRVKNDEMIVLGGLERQEKSERGSGVPFLSRIPILKWIFSTRTKSKNKTVTIVFIRPSIIY